MPPLSKGELFRIVEDSVRRSGWSVLWLPHDRVHPARYLFHCGDAGVQVRVYIWNLTHGGQNRPHDEWRIQVTGIDQFEEESDGKTLILGWWQEGEVFAGFDYQRHRGRFGASPSIQIREAALRQAAVHRFAAQNKGNNELAIAFQRSFLTSYVENLESLHACGQAAEEVAVLQRIGERAFEVADEEIDAQVAEARRYAVISTKRALRKNDFRDRVLAAYSHRCAMCGVQLRLVDGAHIVPVKHPGSTDATHNGIALCALHHRAYDNSLVTFDQNFQILVNKSMIEDLGQANCAEGLERFRGSLRRVVVLPPDARDRPSVHFLELANELRGWSL